MEHEAISRSLAGIIGPVMAAMVTAELPVWNPHLYDQQTITGVYLSGVLLFIAGLSIVRKHPFWRKSWISLITVIGWLAMILGLIRMFFPVAYKVNAVNDLSMLLPEGILILTGLYLTWQGYRPSRRNVPQQD